MNLNGLQHQNGENKLNGLDPKCLRGMSSFIGSDARLYPCCFAYTSNYEFLNWIERHGYSVSDIDIGRNGMSAVWNHPLFEEFYQSFDMPVCQRECGSDSYQTDLAGQPKWERV